MPLQHGIDSYVPERDSLHKKDERPARLCREDCAVLLFAAEPPRLLAARSAKEKGEAEAFPFSVDADELAFTREALPRHSHLLLRAGEKALLVLGEAYAETETAVLLLLPFPAENVARVLLAMGRSDFLLSPSIRAARPSPKRDERIAEQLRELLSVTDRALSPTARVGMRTRSLLLASLAGCRLTADELPTLPDTFSAQETLRVTTLLLCLLLTLRQRDGALAASEEREIGYRLSWTEREGEEGTDEEDAPQDGALPAFLTLPCFAAYRAEQSEEGFFVDLPIRRRTERGRIPILHNREERTRRVIRLRFAREADGERKEKDGATP